MSEEADLKSLSFALSEPREVLNKEIALKLAAPLRPEDGGRSDYTSITLSGKSFTAEAAEVFANAISQMKNLGYVDFSDIIAAQPDDEANRVLEILSESIKDKPLHTLHLSDNALGPLGVHACRSAISNQNMLRTLSFCNDGISAASAEAIAELIIQGAPNGTTNLKQLHFFNNMSGDGGAKAIAKVVSVSPNLIDFRFASSRVKEEGIVALAEALPVCTGLTRLDLSDNWCGESGGYSICEALKTMPSLKSLTLRDTALTDESILKIANLLFEGKLVLEDLDLSYDEITPELAKVIARALRKCPDLKVLKLEGNSELGSAGVLYFARILPSLPKLSVIELQECEIGARGALAIVQAATHVHKDDSALYRLALNGNLIPDAAVEMITEKLESSGFGVEILGDMDENDGEADMDDDADAEISDEEVEADSLADEMSNLKV